MAKLWKMGMIVFIVCGLLTHHEEEMMNAMYTNLAAEMAEGDWFALCDHDDLLASDAVYQIGRAHV